MKKVVLALCFVFALGLVTVNAQEKKAAAKTEQPAAKKAVVEKKAEKKAVKPLKEKKPAAAKK